ncbi:hypothetical protein [Phytohabitans rumicis]|uniref:Sulfatase N-terminal domain-containing protein n=1 Tax=Phytohabitans rumicis TaxID=1076125 RepID=A0A6V8KQ02_9ACTN|nr:hypothetical protein [Phytohabitans rumicis]GFJ87263.1 hypothetical protein Prum_009050 [Phytohabitans rumicis]
MRGERRDSLVQTIDFAPTLLDFFGLPIPDDMRGTPLRDTARDAGLFGSFGGHVSLTDGRYVYMRAPAAPGNTPLLEHTLMPTHMHRHSCPRSCAAPNSSLLYDLLDDPGQERPLADDEVELRMIGLLVELMRANDAPPSQYERLGLPYTGPVAAEHLQIRRQWAQVEQCQARIVPGDYPAARSALTRRCATCSPPRRPKLYWPNTPPD